MKEKVPSKHSFPLSLTHGQQQNQEEKLFLKPKPSLNSPSLTTSSKKRGKTLALLFVLARNNK
jgi:hypothetical protein